MSRFDKKGEIDITMTREDHDAFLEAADKLPDERDEIIRDLAAWSPYDVKGNCKLCGISRMSSLASDEDGAHSRTCPWRRAKELMT